MTGVASDDVRVPAGLFRCIELRPSASGPLGSVWLAEDGTAMLGDFGLAIAAAVRFLWNKDIDVAASVVWGSLGIILGIGFAALSDIWVNGYSLATAVVGEFLPAAGPNLIQAAILVPLLLVAYKAVQKQTGR